MKNNNIKISKKTRNDMIWDMKRIEEQASDIMKAFERKASEYVHDLARSIKWEAENIRKILESEDNDTN